MKIGIISANRRLYSTRRIWEACRKAGHDVRFLHPKKCTLGWNHSTSFLSLAGLKIEGIERVIPRIGHSLTEPGLLVLRHFEYQGVPTPNSAAAILQSRDKIACLQHLAAHNLPIPPTVAIDAPDQLEESLEALGGFPVILKRARGTQGVGVIKIGALDQLRATVETLWQLGEPIFLQRFIAESEGRDLRLFVIGDQVAAAMERVAAPDDFRSNLHRGGTAQGFTPSKELQQLALDAARAVGLGIAGVDILRSDHGPVILELNSSPGLEGIEAATGKDLARLIVRYIERLPQAGPHP